MQKILRTIAQCCLAISSQLRHVATIGKKLVNQQYLLHMTSQCGELWPTNGEFGAPSKLGFASWLCYCTDVAQRRSTKLCTTFGHLLVWYIIYTFSGALCPPPITEFCQVENSLCVQVLHWQRCCTALEQWLSAKLCGMVQGMELRNFWSSSFSLLGAKAR